MTIYFDNLDDYADACACVSDEAALALSTAGQELHTLTPANEDPAALRGFVREAAMLLRAWCNGRLVTLPDADDALVQACAAGSSQQADIARLAKLIRNHVEGFISKKAWAYMLEARREVLARDIQTELSQAQENTAQ